MPSVTEPEMLRLKRASDCNSTLTDVYEDNDDPLASSR